MGTDHWADWLLRHRFGGSEDCQRMTMEAFTPIKDKVIENADLKPGATLLDVGTGDGLIGFGAIDRVGKSGKVIFSDISQPLLDVCKAYATEAGLLEQSEFLKADATDLSSVGSSTIDAVTTRSVIIYVKDKQRAFHEFYRVLKPGGRVSMFEPIAKLGGEFVPRDDYFLGYDIRPIQPIMKKMKEAHRAQHDAQSTMSDFDERDLVRMLQRAGFSVMGLELNVRVGNGGYVPGNWEQFYNSAPNPLVPTLRSQAEAALTSEEQNSLISYLKPLVESNRGRLSQGIAYFTATK